MLAQAPFPPQHPLRNLGVPCLAVPHQMPAAWLTQALPLPSPCASSLAPAGSPGRKQAPLYPHVYAHPGSMGCVRVLLPGTVAELCSEVAWQAHRLSEALHASSQGVRHHSPLPIGAPNSASPPRVTGIKARGSRSSHAQGLTDEPRPHRIQKEESSTLSLRFGCGCWIFPRQLCRGQSSIPVRGSGTGRGLRSPMPTIAPKALRSCWGRGSSFPEGLQDVTSNNFQ